MPKTTIIPKQNETVSYEGDWTGLDGGNKPAYDTANDQEYASGYFGPGSGRQLANGLGSAAQGLIRGEDYVVGERLDSGTYDLWDDSNDGSTMVDNPEVLEKKFMISEDSGSGATNIAEGNGGLNLKIISKDFTVDDSPNSDECVIDIYDGKYVLPRPTYWSKLESWGEVSNPTIKKVGSLPTYTTSGSHQYWDTPGGKFGSSIRRGNHAAAALNTISNSGNAYIYPFGTQNGDFSKGTISLWYYPYTLYDGGGAWSAYGQTYLDLCSQSTSELYVRLKETANSVGPSTSAYAYLWINGVQTSVYLGSRSISWQHIYVVWDVNGLPGGGTIKVFRNGALAISSIDALPDMTNSPGFRIRMGTTAYASAAVYSGANGYALMRLDNLKWFKDVVSASPDWDFNAGGGREEAMHAIYGSINDYKPNDIKLRYYYMSVSGTPAKLKEPTGGDDEEIELEDASGTPLEGVGNFGASTFSKSDYTALVEGVDYNYNERLDTDTGGTDLYDTGDSGPLGGGDDDIFRIVHDGENITKTSGGTHNLGLEIVAKELSSEVNPPETQCYVDPVIGKFILPRPTFWSKLETELNMTNPDIIDNGYSASKSDTNVTWSADTGKLGDCVKAECTSGTGKFSYYYPLGNATDSFEKGTLSFWLKTNSGSSLVRIYFGTDTYVELFDNWYDTWTVTIVIDGTQEFTGAAPGSFKNWTHLYMVWDEAKGLPDSASMRFYINGSIFQFVTEDLPGGDPMAVYVSNNESTSYGMETYIDNIKIWNHVVVADAAWEYKGGVGNEGGLHYMYGQNSPSDTTDYAPRMTTLEDGGVGYFKASGANDFAKWKVSGVKYIGIVFGTGDNCGIANVTIENLTQSQYLIVDDLIDTYQSDLDTSLDEYGDLIVWYTLYSLNDEYEVTIKHSGTHNPDAAGDETNNYWVILKEYLTQEALNSPEVLTKVQLWHTDHNEIKLVPFGESGEVSLTDYQEYIADGIEDEFTLTGLNRASDFIEFYVNDQQYYPGHFSIIWGSNAPSYDNETINDNGYFTVKFNPDYIPESGDIIKIYYRIKADKAKIIRTLVQANDGGTYNDTTTPICLVNDVTEFIP